MIYFQGHQAAPHPLHRRRPLEERAEHLRAVFAAMADYVGAIMLDTRDNAPVGSIDCKYVIGCLSESCNSPSPSSAHAKNLFGLILCHDPVLLYPAYSAPPSPSAAAWELGGSAPATITARRSIPDPQ